MRAFLRFLDFVDSNSKSNPGNDGEGEQNECCEKQDGLKRAGGKSSCNCKHNKDHSDGSQDKHRNAKIAELVKLVSFLSCGFNGVVNRNSLLKSIRTSSESPSALPESETDKQSGNCDKENKERNSN